MTLSMNMISGHSRRGLDIFWKIDLRDSPFRSGFSRLDPKHCYRVLTILLADEYWLIAGLSEYVKLNRKPRS